MPYENLGNMYANQRLGTFEGQLGGNILKSIAKRIAEGQEIVNVATGRTARDARRAAQRTAAEVAADKARQQKLEEEDIAFRQKLAEAKTETERRRIEREMQIREQEAAHRAEIERAELQLMQQQAAQAAATERAKFQAIQSKNMVIAFSVIALVGGLVTVVVLK